MAKTLTVVLLLSSLLAPGSVETITWKVVALAPRGREVLGQGVKTYEAEKDIVVQQRAGGRTWWSKSIPLNDTFVIGASVHREPRLDGFGLWVKRRGDADGFSWEWFERSSGAVFQKLQGSGRVSITLKTGPGYQELESVEFLDDITLRYLDDMRKPRGTKTHEVIVTKGSVLRVLP